MIEKSAKNVIDTDYMEYAYYVLEQRAIPSCIDGLKPTQRKLIHAGIAHAKSQIKVAELGGMLSRFNYHHGEGSAQTALVNMAQDWSNHVPLFKGHGNFGSRLIQEAAAPRYIFVEMSSEFNKYFVDFDVCPKHRDPENPEPQTYLPLIPWVLVNGVKGIAVGFATDILPRDPVLLKKAVSNCLAGKKFSCPDPSFPSFKGEVVKTDTKSWQTRGIVTLEKRNTYLISELPYGYDRETYFNVLTKLEEDGKIEEFVDLCDDSGFKFQIKISQANSSKVAADPHAYFKLIKNHSENITTLDETGKLKIFQTPEELIEYFCNYRTTKIAEKIAYDIDKITEQNSWYLSKANFIESVSDINLTKVKKEELREYASSAALDEKYVDALIKIPVYDFTTEMVDELKKKISSNKKEITRLKKLDPTEEFVRRLGEI